MDDADLLALLEDLNACASDALDALRANRLDDVGMNIKAMLDVIREKLDELDDGE